MKRNVFAALVVASLGLVACSTASSNHTGDSAVIAPPQPRTAWEWLQRFEADTEHWYTHRDGTIHREASGYASDYASGITSSSGNWHARLRNPQGKGCVPPLNEETRCGGTYTPWGRPPVPNPDWPPDGYYTRVDIYLDADWARDNADRRFDFSSAINQAGDGAHLRDFLFNAGTSQDGSGVWIIGTGLRHSRAHADPSNPCPDPSDGRNACRKPATVDQSGWYTFKHIFRSDQGDLAVDMQILDSSGTVIADWTIFDIPMEGVGGEHYGWFANQEVFDLAIDNSGKYLVALSDRPGGQ